jgi:hypothetical protein
MMSEEIKDAVNKTAALRFAGVFPDLLIFRL